MTPDCLQELPTDLFIDAPLHYRREGDGCVLYSVGENTTDDGGRHDFEKGDIVVRTRTAETISQPDI